MYRVILEEFQNESNGAAVDADEEIDAGQRDVCRAGNTEHVRHGVHHRCHRPPTIIPLLLISLIRIITLKILTEREKESRCLKLSRFVW